MPLPADHYVLEACNKLNQWANDPIAIAKALPTEQQTLTLALTMAICDLIKELHEYRR